jgi:hypothetical protein
VITAKAQIVDTRISYQLIERQLEVPNSLAQVILKNKKGQVLVVCQSAAFDIESGTRIQAQNSKIILYLYDSVGRVDSITHPSVSFDYDINKKSLFLEIPAQGNHPTFYSNSLQGIELRAKTIEWHIEEEQLYFDNNQSAICFTSLHYFDAPLMEAYQSLGTTNPLVKMGLYVQKKGSPKAWFDTKEMALLLDKRLEKVVLMDSLEIEKASRNRAFKIIKEKKDFEQFKKGYPSVFKFAGMHVVDVERLITNSAIDENVALPLYLRMLKDGFWDYNKQTKQVQLQDKLFHYVAAMNTKSDYDYDYLKFCALPDKNKKEVLRIRLDFKTQALIVPNVQQIVLGRSQKVLAKPSGLIHLLPNQNLKFNGQIWVGNTFFEGSNFQFEYDAYRVVLPQINRLNLAIYKRVRLKNEWDWAQTSIGLERALNEEGEPTKEVELIKSVIEGGKGYLSIDNANNKSGKNEADIQMSVFVNNSFSRVYYNKRIVKGKAAYPRKSFYYELLPFQLNRLNELQIEQILFKGKFYSANIFSVLENALSLQFSDLSLGFDTLIRKEDKAPVYLRESSLGKGAFYGQVKLSNGGLIGNGILTYLGASLACDVFDFLPEMVAAKQVDSFELKVSKLFPKVEAKQLKMLWKPYENRMYLTSLFTEGFPFHCYYKKEKYLLDGQLKITPNGLLGSGTLDWKQASIVSNPEGDYELKASSIESASVDVLLKIRGQYQFGFEQQNVRLDLDFEQQMARFTSQDSQPLAVFPYNAYQTNLDQFDWDWEQNLLFIKSKNGQKGIFSKEGMQLKSLYFEALEGICNLNSGILTLKKVAPVHLGNALLYLKDAVLDIEEDAYIEKLEGEFVVGDSLNRSYILTAVELIWNAKTNSFLSKGSSFDLKTKDKNGSELVKGKIEILPTKEGLVVKYAWLFLDENWCYFQYKKGALSAVSNMGAIDGIELEDVGSFEIFRKGWF